MGGDLHVAVVANTSEKIYHVVRFSDGSWQQGWTNVNTVTGSSENFQAVSLAAQQ